MEDETGGELLQCLGEKIAGGRDMVGRLKLIDRVDGIDKLIRKIQQEIKFLEKVRLGLDVEQREDPNESVAITFSYELINSFLVE